MVEVGQIFIDLTKLFEIPILHRLTQLAQNRILRCQLFEQSWREQLWESSCHRVFF